MDKERFSIEELMEAARRNVKIPQLKKPAFGITIQQYPKGSGKTTAVVQLMEEHLDLYCIVPVLSHKSNYPKHLQSRVLTVQEFNKPQNRGGKFDPFQHKVVVDEGFFPNSGLIKLYYSLGMQGIPTLVIGT